MLSFCRGKGTLFRNIHNTGRWNHSALGSLKVPINWLGSYVSLPAYNKDSMKEKNLQNKKKIDHNTTLYNIKRGVTKCFNQQN